jgi:pimeloyl-ACP methyl ester carboxylesterase
MIRYWDLPFNNFNYSYIDVALNAGFSTLSLDRLGIGNSSIADPISIIQAPAEVSALLQLNTMLREGKLPGIPHAFNKIVNVGHSFGSVQTYMLAAYHPNATDGIVLTGWSANATYWDATVASWNLEMARLNSPLRFGNMSYADVQAVLSFGGLRDLIGGLDIRAVGGSPADLPGGYLTWSNTGANEYAFLFPEHFDPAILLYAEATKQPVTYGEMLTILGSPSSLPEFSGPVLAVTGGQSCLYVTQAVGFFPM